MSNGWKIAVLKRRRAFLADWLADLRSDGKTHHRSTEHDQREHDALDWAILILEDHVE